MAFGDALRVISVPRHRRESLSSDAGERSPDALSGRRMRFEPRVSPEVDAVRVSRHTVPEIESMVAGTDLRVAYVDGAQPGFKPEPTSDESKVVVVGLVTSLFVYEGEWLARDATGTFRKYDPEEFCRLYEPVV